MSRNIRCTNLQCNKLLTIDSETKQAISCPACRTVVINATETRDSRPAATTSGSQKKTTLQSIGRFIVKAKLGEGAFGTVYRAYDPQLERDVALKVPHPGSMNTPKRIERFLREAKAAANLRHPHIVPVYDAGQEGNRNYIAAAFIDGETLGHHIKENGNPLAEAARYCRELSEALAYAHEQGIVHRDVKPANIMVDKQGHVHLMDFGLAMRQEEESRITNDGALLGTPSYMSPEQAIGVKEDCGPASDQYSAGVVLYELLTGQTPFSGPPASVIHSVINTEPVSPSSIRKGLPRDLETICLKAMSKQPEKRYATCQELADDLKHWQDGEPIRARRLSNWERLSRLAKRNRTLAAMTALLILVLAGATVIASILAAKAYASSLAAERAAEHANEQRQEADRHKELAERQKERAEQESAKVALERKAAEEARTKAEAESKRANLERDSANEQRKIAEEKTKALIAERKRVFQYAYMTNIRLAHKAWEDRRDLSMLNLLGEARMQHETDDPDKRNFEWYYLNRLTKSANNIISEAVNVKCKPVFSNNNFVLSQNSNNSNDIVAYNSARYEMSDFIKLATPNLTMLALATSPDNQGLVAIADNGAVYYWKSWKINGNPIRLEKVIDTLYSYSKSKLSSCCAVFSPNGKNLAIGTSNGLLLVVDITSLNVIHSNIIEDAGINCISYNANGTAILVCADNTAKLMNANNGAEKATFIPSSLPVDGPPGVFKSFFRGAAFISDDNRIVMLDKFGSLHIYSSLGNYFKTITVNGAEIKHISACAKGSKLLVCTKEDDLKILDCSTMSCVFQPRCHLASIEHIASSHNGNFAVATDRTGKMQLVHLYDEQQVPFAKKNSQYSLDGKISKTHAFLLQGDSLSIIPLEDPSHAHTVSIGTMSNSIKLRVVQDEVIAITNKDIHFLRIDGNGKSKIDRIKKDTVGYERHDTSTLRHDGLELAVKTSSQNYEVIDLVTGNQVLSITAEYAAYSHDGMLNTINRSYISKQNLQYKTQEWLTLGHFSVCCSSRFGNGIAVGGVNGELILLDNRTGKMIRKLSGHSAEVTSLAFSPDGKRLFSGSKDHSIIVWDIETGAELIFLKKHKAPVTRLEISPDGHRLLSMSTDGTFYLWDARPW